MSHPLKPPAALFVLLLAGCTGTQDMAEMIRGMPQPSEALWPAPERTANRSVSARILYPKWILQTEEFPEYNPARSNRAAHPAQWEGQDWDPAMWNKDWTPETAVRKFREADIIHAQYFEKNMPVVETGTMFYKISDLDRRRVLKLFADYSGVFAKGYKTITLRDWKTHEVVGTYSEKGMLLK
jgi:hypothetical protein